MWLFTFKFKLTDLKIQFRSRTRQDFPCSGVACPWGLRPWALRPWAEQVLIVIVLVQNSTELRWRVRFFCMVRTTSISTFIQTFLQSVIFNDWIACHCTLVASFGLPVLPYWPLRLLTFGYK